MNLNKIQKLLFFVAFMAITQIGYSQIYHVNQAALGSNDGTNWTNAFTNLQSALAIATAGTEIWVAQGTYYPTTCTPCTVADRNISFQIPDGVKVFGGFNGTETAQTDRDWITNLTVLSGDINQDGAPTGNSYSVVFTLHVSSATIVDGFTIRSGCANENTGAGRTVDGGGWYNDGSAGFTSNPKVQNVRFVFNKANRGAGMFNAGGFGGEASPLYQDVEFRSNSSDGDGGGCMNDGNFDGESSPQFYSCEFFDNTSNGSGAGMFNNGAGIKDTLGNIIFSGNSNPFIVNCIFKNNTGFTANGIGGGIYNLGSKGGSCSPSIINTLFVQNRAYAAAAIYNHGGDEGLSSPSIINCTFADNEADPFNIGGGTGGAVYNNASLNGTAAATVVNCIFWGNTALNGSEVFRNVGGTPFIAFSLIDKPDCASTNSGSGGNTVCGNGMIYNQNPNFINPAICDYRLQGISPALDAGDNQVNGIATDLDSLPRITNGTIDLGPYELESFSLPIDLLSFTARYDGEANVNLLWTTISDHEGGTFEVERSADGFEFETIGKENSSSRLNEPVTYQFDDKKPLNGKSYYRIKIIDETNKIIYTRIQSISIFNATILAYPNPVTTELKLNFNEEELDGAIEYYIYDIAGHEINYNNVSAENDISIPVGHLTEGFHTLVIFLNGNKVLTHRFISTKL